MDGPDLCGSKRYFESTIKKEGRENREKVPYHGQIRQWKNKGDSKKKARVQHQKGAEPGPNHAGRRTGQTPEKGGDYEKNKSTVNRQIRPRGILYSPLQRKRQIGG